MIETKFKKSEVGLIPVDWEDIEVGYIANLIQTGPFGSQLHQSDYITVGIPVVMPKDLVDGRISDTSIARVSKENVERLKRHKIKEGDFLFARRGDVGRCALTSKKEVGWLCGTGCFRVSIDKQKCDINYLYYQLQRKETVEWIVSKAIGSTMLNLNTSILSQIPVIQPESIAEQSRIAEALSDMDVLIATTKKLIEKKRNIKEGAMQDLLSGKRRLPGFTGKWVETSIGKLCKPYKGSQINKNDLEVSQSGYPVMNGGVSPSGFHYDYNESANTIIMSEGGNSCGYVSYMKTAFWAGGHCYVLRPTEPISLDYLYQLLKYNEPAIMDLRTGSGLPNIKKSSLNGFTLTISQNKEEQKAIAQVLSDMDSEIHSLEVRLTKYQSMKQGMMQQLLTGKIRLI
jgi:Restriction endonuclease S subunits